MFRADTFFPRSFRALYAGPYWENSDRYLQIVSPSFHNASSVSATQSYPSENTYCNSWWCSFRWWRCSAQDDGYCLLLSGCGMNWNAYRSRARGYGTDRRPCDIATSPCDMATRPCDMATSPCDTATSLYDMATGPCDMATYHCDMATGLCDMATGLCDMATSPCDIAISPCDIATGPCDMATSLCGIATSLCGMATSLNDADTPQHRFHGHVKDTCVISKGMDNPCKTSILRERSTEK